MTEEKEYTRRCIKCGEAGLNQWFYSEPVRVLRAITEFDERGGLYGTEDIEQQELGVVGVHPYFECLCGASFRRDEWSDLEVVEVES